MKNDKMPQEYRKALSNIFIMNLSHCPMIYAQE